MRKLGSLDKTGEGTSTFSELIERANGKNKTMNFEGYKEKISQAGENQANILQTRLTFSSEAK